MSKRHHHHQERAAQSPAEQPEAAAGEALAGGGAEAAPGVAVQPEDPQAALRREVEEWKDKYLRARAEMQNAARRATNEREDAVRFGNAGLLRDLLNVVDDLDRALAASGQSESVASVVDGVKLVQENLAKFLRTHQVETIEAQGAAFDPMQHEALLQQPTSDVPPGTVLQQVQRGYRLRDRVLRPAKVIVATAPAGANESGD